MSQYVSSIVNLYGDTQNVKKDARTLKDIIRRQGGNLLLDVLADYLGESANGWKLNEEDRCRLMQGNLSHFKEAMAERI